MPDGEIYGWSYSSRKPVRLRWKDGVIVSMELTPVAVATGLWLAPSLLDLQINGFAGIDFQRDELTEAELFSAVAGLQAAGCGQFLLTLMTDRWEALTSRLRHLRKLRAHSPKLQAAIAGWHLEGPFLSAKPGFCGAHDPGLMIDPSLQQIRQLREVTGADPVLLTLAPERIGALEAIRLAVSLGIKVSLGHTDASADTLRRAFLAGATGFTHLGNACPQELDRHDNILWRMLDIPGLTASLIPDGLHVSPALFRLVHRLLPRGSLYYTTDAVAAAGAVPGRYTVGRHQVDVGPDQIVRQPGKTNYAGSGLSPIAGVFRAAAMLGCSWQCVWDLLSLHPARFMGMSRELEVGRPANLCLVELDRDGRLARVRTWVGGEKLAENGGNSAGGADFHADHADVVGEGGVF